MSEQVFLEHSWTASWGGMSACRHCKVMRLALLGKAIYFTKAKDWVKAEPKCKSYRSVPPVQPKPVTPTSGQTFSHGGGTVCLRVESPIPIKPSVPKRVRKSTEKNWLKERVHEYKQALKQLGERYEETRSRCAELETKLLELVSENAMLKQGAEALTVRIDQLGAERKELLAKCERLELRDLAVQETIDLQRFRSRALRWFVPIEAAVTLNSLFGTRVGSFS